MAKGSGGRMVHRRVEGFQMVHRMFLLVFGLWDYLVNLGGRWSSASARPASLKSGLAWPLR